MDSWHISRHGEQRSRIHLRTALRTVWTNSQNSRRKVHHAEANILLLQHSAYQRMESQDNSGARDLKNSLDNPLILCSQRNQLWDQISTLCSLLILFLGAPNDEDCTVLVSFSTNIWCCCSASPWDQLRAEGGADDLLSSTWLSSSSLCICDQTNHIKQSGALGGFSVMPFLFSLHVHYI